MVSLGPAGAAAVRWSLLAGGARFAVQLGAQVLLARLLGPQAFGVFAVGLVLLTLAQFLSGLGFGWSLLQRQDLQDEDIRFAWTWQLLASGVAGGALWLLAPALSALLQAPAAQDVIRWLALGGVLQAAGAPAAALLQRQLDFRALGLVQLGSYAVGYLLVGLPLAWAGAGVQALVAAWLVQAATATLASLALAPHDLRPLLWYGRAGQVLRTGSTVFLTNLVNWSLAHLDRLLIARLLGTAPLGLYNMACSLASVPQALLLGALQPAFLAAGARLQDQRPRLQAAYRQMLASVLVLGLPVFAALALLAPDLVQLLYGPAWISAGPVLGLLLAAVPAWLIWGISTPVLWNTGRPQHEFALQLPLIPLGVLLLWLAAPHGIGAAALAVVGLLALRALLLGLAALRALDLPLVSLLPHALRGLLLTAGAAATVWAGQRSVHAWAQPLASLLAGGLLPLGLALAVLWWRPRWWPRLLGAECWRMLLRFVPGLEAASGHKGAALHPQA